MHQPPPVRQRSRFRWWWSLVILAGLAVLLAGLWTWRFRTYTPKEALLDLRAAARSRHAPRPVERFLELRYGPLTEATNRQHAFLDFFNQGHIEGLYMISGHLKDDLRRARIADMAKWLGQYRQSLTPGEKAALRARLETPEGKVMLQKATSLYLSRDVAYRAATAPVITELMTTLAEIKKP
jgi:hypothetical protein